MTKMQVIAKSEWLEVRASETQSEILIYGDIGESWWSESITAKEFVDAMSAIKGKELTVRINSYGGSVSDGLAIYNAIKRHDQATTCQIDGMAVSCASLIAMAGSSVKMASNALMMVHAPWGYASGNAVAMRDMADVLDKYAEAMASSYMSKTGKAREEIMSILTDGSDHWYSAEEALSFGFIDEITDPVMASASLTTGRFHRPKGHISPTHEVIPMPKATPAGDLTDPANNPTTETLVIPLELDTDTIRAQVIQDEKNRRDGIKSRLQVFSHNPEVKAILDESLDDPSVTIEKATERALKAMGKGMEPAGSPLYNPSIQSGKTSLEKMNEGITAALSARAGLEKRDPANEFGSFSLIEMARASLMEHGVAAKGLSKLELVQAALPNDAKVRASTLGQSTSDFANLLANIANKSMLKGYAEAGETFQNWTSAGTLPDFKIAKRVDLNEFPSLSHIDEGGEYSIGTLSDRGESLQLATYGKKFTITRQAIINDDLSAFTRIPQKMGRAAIRTIGNLVYAVLTGNPAMSDGVALFHASHSNLLDAAGITTDSIAKAMQAMMKQKDASGNTVALNIPLQYVIVPVALSAAAWVAANSEFEVDASQKASNKPNYVRGRFQVIEDARLDVASTSIWYGLASAQMFDTIEVSYLDGNDQPYLEQQPGWDVDGVEFKVRIDAGVKALDYRTMVRTG